MKTKKDALLEYLSIRICKNIDEYLQKCNKTGISKEVKHTLENYIVKLPSIFKLLTNYNDFLNFCGNKTDKEILIDYRNKLIFNYYRLIKELIPSILRDQDSKLCNAYESFKKFCKVSLELSGNEICPNNPKVLKETILKLNSDLKEKINDFYGFFNVLYNSEKKDLLFKFNVIGDIPCNVSFKLFCRDNLNNHLTLSDINLGIGIAGITIGTSLYIVGQPIPALITSGVGAGFVFIDCGINVAMTIFKSGYFKGVLILNPKTYILDI